jgi:membrane protein implicated in regulation of membrane protease activity
MRIALVLAVVLVFAAGFILDTAGVAQLLYICATGGCGVKPFWLLSAAGVVLAVCVGLALVRRLSARRSSRKQPASKPRRKAAASAKGKAPAKTTRTRRRKKPAGG